jgi:type I site-specific restriction-modification system R (restriction) subunit
MAVVSLRLTKNEENIIDFLTNYYEEDKSSLIKHSLKELYEDIVDNSTIDQYEKNETRSFVSGEEIIKLLQKEAPSASMRTVAEAGVNLA